MSKLVNLASASGASGLSILYIGENSGTSRHRAQALQRLGHKVSILDPWRLLPNNHTLRYWAHLTGGLFLAEFVCRRVLAELSLAQFDLALVNGGQLVSGSLVHQLKSRFGLVINYNNDDPYGPRDGNKWRLYLDAVPVYDLVVVLRDSNVTEASAAGARRVLRVPMSADEVAHAPRVLSTEEQQKWASEVAFIGTWMPERGPFLASLIRLGVPLSIFGDRWHKAKEWRVLRPHWRGPGLYRDDDYSKAVLGAKVCLGLLSKGNRDLSTQRSFEVPHLGGVLCAERTSEHLQLYREDQEAVFWKASQDCAEKCKQLLANLEWRERLARKGRQRCLANRTTNESIMEQILSFALSEVLCAQ